MRTGRILTLPPGQHAFSPAAGDRTALVEFKRQGSGGRIVVSACDLPSLEVKTLIDREISEAQQGLLEMAFSEVCRTAWCSDSAMTTWRTLQTRTPRPKANYGASNSPMLSTILHR